MILREVIEKSVIFGIRQDREKTITSFKTAWLASRLPNVDKVVFVVDRIALTKQTNEKYRAYDPDGSIEEDSRTGKNKRYTKHE